jgi:hypothetical protein
MHNSLKIIKTLLYSYFALHVSGTLVPIIRNLLILHIQPPVTVCRWVGCIFQLWSVTTVAFATVVTDQSWKPKPTALVTSRSYGKPEAAAAVDRLLMLGIGMPETC